MKRKKAGNRIFIVVAILLAAAFLVMFVYKPSSRKEDPAVRPGVSIPEFRKDGTLSFIVRERRDTVRIEIEVVKDQSAIMRGLMYRLKMEDYQGMLFIFPEEEKRWFWMKNTYIPLDIIYLDDDLKIVTIQADTQPLSEESIPSELPARYVLEVNAGFAAVHGIREGDKIEFSITPSQGF